MSLGEILLTLMVALLVLGPKKLPLAAYHLGTLMKHLLILKQRMIVFWQKQIQEQQLQENIKKAEAAEIHYQKKKFINEREQP